MLLKHQHPSPALNSPLSSSLFGKTALQTSPLDLTSHREEF